LTFEFENFAVVMSPTRIKKGIYIGSLRYSVEASETLAPFCLLPSLFLSLSLATRKERVPLKSVGNIIASIRVPVMEGFAFNFDNDRRKLY